MDTIPNEILENILLKLDTRSLQNCTNVCKLWKEIVQIEIDQRIEVFNNLSLIDETKKEIGTFVPPPEEVDPSLLLPLSLSSLQIYEQTLLPSRYVISTKVETQVGNFLKYMWVLRNCDCEDIDFCTLRSIHFMPCFNLFLVQIPGKFIIYNEKDLYSKWTKSKVSKHKCMKPEPYEYEASLIKLNVNDPHVLTSIYHNYVVYQELSRVLLLFKINSVNHETRNASVQLIRRIYFPQWICALHLFNDKLFVVYTTGYFGCWDRIQNNIHMSAEKCELVNMTEEKTTIFRILNLIFVKQISFYNGTFWTLLDGNSTSLDLINNINLGVLFSTVFDNDIGEINSLHILNNILIVHCKDEKVKNDDKEEDQNERIFVGRLKRDLILDDFLPPNVNDFENLFFKNSHQESDNLLPFKGSFLPPIIISPFLYNSIQDSYSNLVTYCLAIQRTNIESKRLENRKILEIVSININANYINKN